MITLSAVTQGDTWGCLRWAWPRAPSSAGEPDTTIRPMFTGAGECLSTGLTPTVTVWAIVDIMAAMGTAPMAQAALPMVPTARQVRPHGTTRIPELTAVRGQRKAPTDPGLPVLLTIPRPGPGA